MSDKSPEMEKFLNDISKSFFGRERTGNQCVTCGSTKVGHDDFRDIISRKEFKIAHICQECQDRIYAEED